MTETTVELDTKQEAAPSQNGHDEKWQTFASDDAMLQHIASIEEPAEEIIEIPEWGVKVLCKALDPEGRVVVEGMAYDAETKRSNYGKVAHLFALYGTYNPTTGRRVFSAAHEGMLKAPKNGGPVARIFMVVFRLSGILSNDVEQAKKK